MSGNCPVSGLEDITQPISIGDLMIISQDTSSGFMSAQMNVGEFLSQVFEENSATGGKLSDLATELADLENRVGVLETNQAIKDLVEAVFHVGSKHMTTSLEWNPGEALRKFFGKRTNWVLYPYVPYGVVSENVPLGGIVPLLKGTGRSAANLRIWERLPDNAGNYRVNITPDKTAINEGDTVTFTITMIGVEPGTLVNYQFLAIDAADLDPNSEAKLEGSFVNSGSGVNTLTLKTVPNRRNDGDRIVSLNIPSYQAIGTFVLVDSSKALDGVINVLPGTSQLITLAPNQQADVWITGGGGSGGISKGANTRGDNVEPIAFVNGGTLNNYVLKSGEEIEVELWGGGGSTGGLESTSTTKSFLKNGDGESSSLNFEGSNFTAGGGRGHSLSALTVSGKWRHDASNHEGGVNTVINQNPDKVEITVLENAAGPAGSTTNDVYPKNAHNNVGAGVRGISGTAFDGTKLTISGGGAGGYLKLRIKNNRSGDITLPFKAGYRGEGFTPEYMDFCGRLGYHGGIRISKYSNATTTMLTAPGKNNLVLRPGQRAEVWMVGNGSSLRSTNEATAPTEYPTTVTVGSAVYKAGGGLNNRNHPIIISSVPPMNIFDYLFAKNTIPTSGLPAGVVVNIIEDRIGNTLTYKITNDPNASLQTSYVTPKPNTFKGYTGFGLGSDGKVFDVLQGVFHPGSNGSILGIEIVNNGSSDLTIPMEVPAFNLSTEKPITIDELLNYDILRRNASSGCVIALIDKDDSGAIGTPTESDKVKVTEVGVHTVSIPAGYEMEFILYGSGGGGGAHSTYPSYPEQNGGKGGDTRLTIGAVDIKAHGGYGGSNSLYNGMDGRNPGVGGEITTPGSGFPVGVNVSYVESKVGVAAVADAWVNELRWKQQLGAAGYTENGFINVGAGGNSNTGGGSLYFTGAGGGGGGYVKVRVKNENALPVEVVLNIGKGGIAGTSLDQHGNPGLNGGAVYSQVVVMQESVGYNGEWSYVAFQSPLISGSSSPYIEDIYWATDEAGLNRITGSNLYGDHAYFIIKTIDVEGSVILSLASSGLTQDEMGGGELGKEITIPITKIGTTNKGIGSYLIQTLDDDEMSFRNSKYVSFTIPAERTHSTIYTNTSDYTIVVAVRGSGGTRELQVSVDGSTWVGVGNLGGSNETENAYAIVPPGHKYRINGSCVINTWSEMRYKGIK